MQKTITPINTDCEPLTAEKLKTFEGFEHLTDQQAEQVAEFIRQYAMILHGCYAHQQEMAQLNQAQRA